MKTLASTAAALLLAGLVQAQALTDGEVRKVDAAAGKVTLKHEAIKNLDMPPMTMVFRVKDPAWLAKLQPGDKVRFAAQKQDGQYTVTALQPAK